jgi:hypothetical protein
MILIAFVKKYNKFGRAVEGSLNEVDGNQSN